MNSVDSIANSITEIQFNPETKQKFASWFSRCEDIFRHEFHMQGDKWKLCLLLRKLGTKEYQRYKHFILHKTPGDFTLTETVVQLTDIFGELSSLFNTRYKLKKDDNEDFFAHAGKVNLQCENFQLKSLTKDQFKCLIFIAGLQSPNDPDIRTRLLPMLEQDRDMAVQTLTTECQRLIKFKRDTEMIQQEPFKSSVSSRVISIEKSLT